MHYSYTNISNPTILDDLTRVYEHLTLIESELSLLEKDLIKEYYSSAIDWVENYCGIVIVDKLVMMSYDANPSYGFLLRFPTTETSVTRIRCRKNTVALQTYPRSKTYIDNLKAPNELVFVDDPLGPPDATNIQIEYEAIAGPIPPGLHAALLLLTGHFYQNRAMATDVKFITVIQNILRPYKMAWHH